jgi:hypothetical protein
MTEKGFRLSPQELRTISYLPSIDRFIRIYNKYPLSPPFNTVRIFWRTHWAIYSARSLVRTSMKNSTSGRVYTRKGLNTCGCCFAGCPSHGPWSWEEPRIQTMDWRMVHAAPDLQPVQWKDIQFVQLFLRQLFKGTVLRDRAQDEPMEHYFRLKLPVLLHGFISLTISWHCPFKVKT